MEVHQTNYIKTVIISRDKIFTIGLWTITTVILILIFGLLIYILSKGLPKITPSFLVDLPDEIEKGGGVGPFLFNSFYVLLISLFISIPIGIGSGVYLAEYAPNNRFTDFIKNLCGKLSICSFHSNWSIWLCAIC